MVQIVQEMAEEAAAASKQGPGGAEGAQGATERERQAAVAAAAAEALKFGCRRDAASFLRVYGWDSGERRTCSLARPLLAGWGSLGRLLLATMLPVAPVAAALRAFLAPSIPLSPSPPFLCAPLPCLPARPAGLQLSRSPPRTWRGCMAAWRWGACTIQTTCGSAAGRCMATSHCAWLLWAGSASKALGQGPPGSLDCCWRQAAPPPSPPITIIAHWSQAMHICGNSRHAGLAVLYSGSGTQKSPIHDTRWRGGNPYSVSSIQMHAHASVHNMHHTGMEAYKHISKFSGELINQAYRLPKTGSSQHGSTAVPASAQQGARQPARARPALSGPRGASLSR
jgi:hypothetical protein